MPLLKIILSNKPTINRIKTKSFLSNGSIHTHLADSQPKASLNCMTALCSIWKESRESSAICRDTKALMHRTISFLWPKALTMESQNGTIHHRNQVDEHCPVTWISSSVTWWSISRTHSTEGRKKIAPRIEHQWIRQWLANQPLFASRINNSLHSRFPDAHKCHWLSIPKRTAYWLTDWITDWLTGC